MDTGINFRILFFIVLAGMLIARMYFNLRVRMQGERIMPNQQAIQREGVAMFATRVVMFFVLIGILVLYAIDHPWIKALNFTLPDWPRWLGFVIGLLSIALIIWTEIELDRQFSPQLQLREQHRLVISGPYERIRHPLYTALETFGLSLALVSANWIFVTFFIITLAGLLYRVPKEEQMMLEQFGDEYKEYMQRTGRYLPRL